MYIYSYQIDICPFLYLFFFIQTPEIFFCLAFSPHVFTTVDKIRNLVFDSFRPGFVHVTFKRKYDMLEQIQAFVQFSLPMKLKRISGLFPACYAVKACYYLCVIKVLFVLQNHPCYLFKVVHISH